MLIEQIGIEVTPQTVCTLNSIAAKIPKYNTHTHTLYDQSTASFIQSMIWDFELNLEFFKSDIPGLLPADNDNNWSHQPKVWNEIHKKSDEATS